MFHRHHPLQRLHTICLGTLLLVLGFRGLYGQEANTPSPYHLSIKVQAYSPLSWLAEQVIPDLYPLYTPRFWTGELELGLSDRHAVFGSVGIRRKHDDFASETSYDRTDGYRITVGYADYFHHAKRGALSGPFYAPFLRWLKSTRDSRLPSLGIGGNFTTCAGSVGTLAGWKQYLGKHLELSAAIGLELGYQWHPNLDYEAPSDQVSTFDFTAIQIWKNRSGYYPNVVSLGLTSSLSVGWKIF